MDYNQDLLDQVYRKIKGKVVVLFGPTLVGKTTLALHLSKKFKNPVLFWIDKNIPEGEIKKINENITIWDIDTYATLYDLLKQIEGYQEHVSEKYSSDIDKMKKYSFDFIIVDSLTGLNEELALKYRPPKLYLELAQNQKNVLFLLSRLKKKGVTSLVITHSRLADFETKKVEPSINNKVLKHVDTVLYMYVDKEGNRILKLWADRKVPKQINFRFYI